MWISRRWARRWPQRGAVVHLAITQRAFLLAMGLEAQDGACWRRKADAPAAHRHQAGRSPGLRRRSEMGNLFKVLAATSPGLAQPYPFGSTMIETRDLKRTRHIGHGFFTREGGHSTGHLRLAQLRHGLGRRQGNRGAGTGRSWPRRLVSARAAAPHGISDAQRRRRDRRRTMAVRRRGRRPMPW